MHSLVYCAVITTHDLQEGWHWDWDTMPALEGVAVCPRSFSRSRNKFPTSVGKRTADSQLNEMQCDGKSCSWRETLSVQFPTKETTARCFWSHSINAKGFLEKQSVGYLRKSERNCLEEQRQSLWDSNPKPVILKGARFLSWDPEVVSGRDVLLSQGDETRVTCLQHAGEALALRLPQSLLRLIGFPHHMHMSVLWARRRAMQLRASKILKTRLQHKSQNTIITRSIIYMLIALYTVSHILL